jgi:hypothetical protein
LGYISGAQRANLSFIGSAAAGAFAHPATTKPKAKKTDIHTNQTSLFMFYSSNFDYFEFASHHNLKLGPASNSG